MKQPAKAKTPKPAATKTTVAEAIPNVRPAIDYPKQNERITSRHYGMRVTAPAAEEVDVSINQGPWMPCRESVGHWWYDWTGFDAGEHEVIFRSRAKGGRWLVSTPHEFFVE